MKIHLLRNATIATLLLLTGAAFAQGPGHHAGGRGGPAASQTHLAYGTGYQARRMQQADHENQRARRAGTKPDGECAPATTTSREPDPARVKEPGLTPAPARRDVCVATSP